VTNGMLWNETSYLQSHEEGVIILVARCNRGDRSTKNQEHWLRLY
jgi:hypothetical protein